MSEIDSYMSELESALHVRGAARRRFLRECRDLVDAAAERGDEAAVQAFGPARELAAAFDAEAAARRGLRSTLATAAGVLATGGSTLVVVNHSTATAPTWWAIAFFVAAQLAAVAAGLSAVQVLVLRRSTITPGELTLLGRRNICALAAAGVTMLSAGAAAPGHGSAALILAGPGLVCVAIVAVLRARSQARRLDGSRVRVARQPLADLAKVARIPLPPIDLRRALPFVTAVAAAAAFTRDLGEHATAGNAGVAAGIEAAAVVACFFVLGPALGLYRR
jgi:hypothetical protein